MRVWNRQRFIKDPTTGRRVARANPRETWITTAVPEFAIIDTHLWDHAQARLQAGHRAVAGATGSEDAAAGSNVPNIGGRLAAARRPAWLLSGLVCCGLCEGPMSVVANNGRLGCANHVERGTCANPRTLLRDTLLRRVLTGLKERLLTAELVAEFVSTYVSEINAANKERGSRQAGLATEQAKLGRQIRNLLELIKDGHGSPAMVGELRELERRHDVLNAQIASNGKPELILTLHPNLPELYRRKVATLEKALAEPATAAAAAEALRSLIDEILIFPGERRGEMTIQLRGDLAAFLHLPEGDSIKPTAIQTAIGRRSGVMVSLVAGARNHRQLTPWVVGC